MNGVSLKDIGRNLYTDVELGEGESVRVRGLSLDDVIYLVDKYPPIEKALMDRDIRAGLEVKDIMRMVPEAIGAIILCGMEQDITPDNAEIVRKWPIGDQASVVGGILRRTFKRGIGPFVDELEALGVLSTRKSSGAGSRAQATNSHSQPNSLSTEGTPEQTSSEQPQENSSPGLN